MPVRAIVRGVNPARGRVAAEAEGYGWVEIELMGGPEPEKGDTLLMQDSEGPQDIRNETQRRIMPVCVQRLGSSRESAARYLAG